jgi:trigger factor
MERILRTAAFCLIDAIIVNIAYLGAFLLRFDGVIPAEYLVNYPVFAVSVTVITISVYYIFGFYRKMWQYASIREMYYVFLGVTAASLVVIAAAYIFIYPEAVMKPMPRSIYPIAWLLNLVFTSGSRFGVRFFREYRNGNGKNGESAAAPVNPKRALIIGAGEAGAMVAKEMYGHPTSGLLPVGFIDDDLRKQGMDLFNIPVLGRREDIPHLVVEYKIDEIIIAMPSAPGQKIREIVDICKGTGVRVKTVPGVYELIDGKVEVLPEVELGEYKGVSAVVPEVKVGDDEVENQLKLLQQRHGRLVDAGDKAIDDGDVAVIELETKIDGDIEPRLTKSEQPIEVGAAKFIPGLDAHLLGMNVSEEKEFTMNLPSVYQYEDLEGKEAEFKVKVTAVKVKEYPELDDEFAKDVSEYSTLDEFKEFMRTKMEETGHINAKRIFKERVVSKVVDGVEVDIPESLLNQQLRQETNRFVQRLAMQQLSVDDYLKLSNKDNEGLRQELEESARNTIKTQLVLSAVAKAEGIKVTPEELEQEIDDLAAQYNVETDKIRADLAARNQLALIEEGLLFDKVQDFLAENAVALTEEPQEEVEQEVEQEAESGEEAHQEAGLEEPQPPEDA